MESILGNGIDIINQLYDKEKIGTQFISRLLSILKDVETHRNQIFL